MFWGLVLEPSKRYTQRVEQSFHISQAVLELNSSDNEPIQLILEFDGSDFVLANLSKKHNMWQVPLDLNFQVGDQISFRTIGKGRVHLSGYHVPEDELEGLMNMEESDLEETQELEESLTSPPTGKRKKELGSSQKKKKAKIETVDSDESDESDEDTSLDATTMDESSMFYDSDLSEEDDDDYDDDDLEEADEEEEDEEGGEAETSLDTSRASKKSKGNEATPKVNGVASAKKDKKNKSRLSAPAELLKGTPKKEGKSPKQELQKTPKGQSPKSPKSPGQKRVLEGGVVVEELKAGVGTLAKAGRMAQVYYSGRLKANNKLFDETTHGAGFKFRLGKGEVIRGWDIGVAGMQVGGKRRITIPPALAYGPKGSPPVIPPNSTLVFEVELKGLS